MRGIPNKNNRKKYCENSVVMFYLSGKCSGMEANSERETDNGRQGERQDDKSMGYSEGTEIQGRSEFAITVCTIF